MPSKSTHKSAFTLLEILLVVGIIAILAGIVIVALNPTKQFAQVRNTQRKANLSELNKALYQYYIDHSHYPTTLTTTLTEICATGASSTPTGIVCTGLVDLSALVPTYLVAIPADPQGSLSFLESLIPTAYAITNGTGYLVALNSASKPYLEADNAELNQSSTIGNINGVMPDRLAAYWSFDDAGAGTAIDSVNGNNGILHGDVIATSGIKSLSNTAYAFDGTGDYITAVSNMNLSSENYSISAWIKSYTTNEQLILHGWNSVATDERFRLYVSNSSYVAIDDYNCGFSSGSFVTNSWHHVVFTYDYLNQRAYLYVDGVYKARETTAFDQAPNTISTFYIGAYRTSSYFFNGAIDSIRVYNKALSADEVLNIYNTEKP